MRNRLFLAAIAATAFGVVSCGGSQTGPSGDGTLRVMLRDSPYSDARSLLVTLSEVSVHRAGDGTPGDEDGGEWISVPFPGNAGSRTCDLKKLEQVQDIVGATSADPGHYTQIRLHVAAAALYFDNPSEGDACQASIATPDGRTAPLEIPSGEIRLNRPFDVSADDTTTIVLDFDGDKSVHQTGNGRYMMTPVIAVVSVD